MEEMGGRLFFLWDELDTASDDPRVSQCRVVMRR
jgi:hypothetical protein